MVRTKPAPDKTDTPTKAKKVPLPTLTAEPADQTVSALRTQDSIPQWAVDAMRAALSGPQQFRGLDSEEQVKQAVSLLQRTATQLQVGLTKTPVKQTDGTYTLVFQAKETKRTRKYTTQDIRTWHDENFTPPLPAGKVPADVRKAYRIQHGHEKGDS